MQGGSHSFLFCSDQMSFYLNTPHQSRSPNVLLVFMTFENIIDWCRGDTEKQIDVFGSSKECCGFQKCYPFHLLNVCVVMEC